MLNKLKRYMRALVNYASNPYRCEDCNTWQWVEITDNDYALCEDCLMERCPLCTGPEDGCHETPSGEYICQSCYEFSIDAAHDAMSDYY